MKRSLSLAALFGVVALLAALLWLSKSSTTDGETAVGPRAAASQARDSAAATTAPRSDTDTSAGPARTELAQAEAGVAPAETNGAASVRAERSVLVVDGLTRTPLANIELFYEEFAGDSTAKTHAALDNKRLDAWLDAGPKSTRTDAAGGAVLDTRLDRDCVVLARASGALGRGRFESDEQGARQIELWPDATLEVLVVGPQGAPLPALQVALSVRSFNAYAPQYLTPTNDAGRARFEHIGLTLAQHEASWCVELSGLFGDEARAMLDRTALPREIVVLHAAAFGAVELRAWDANGAPLASGMVSLHPIEPGAELGVQPSFLHRRAGMTCAIANGVARFEPVRLGGELELAIAPDGDTSQALRIRAPTSQGEVVKAEFRDPRAALVLRARLVDEQGAVLAERDVNCIYMAPHALNPDMLDSEQRSDAQGYVRFPLGADRAQGERRTLEFAVEDPDTNRRSARIELAPAYAPGEHDLGEVRLALPPCVVAGRVLNAQGEPVEDADVWATCVEPTGNSSATVRSGRNGAFEVRASWECAELHVNAASSAALAPTARALRGARDVELVLRESGWIDGKLLLDAGVARRRLRVQARLADLDTSHDERARQGSSKRMQAQLDGTFRIERLEPGRYDLDILGDHQSDPLLSLQGFDVPSGAACADERLLGIDLRGMLTAFRLDFVPPNSSDVVLGTLEVKPLVDSSNSFRVWLHDSYAEIVIRGPAARVAVNVSGFRAEVLERVSTDTRVQLRRGPRVRLKAPADSQIPAAPMFVKVSLSPVGSTGPGYDHYQAEVFDVNRELVLNAPGAGEFVLSWSVEKRTEESVSTMSVQTPDEQRITVLESDVEQIFEVRWPREALEAALKL